MKRQVNRGHRWLGFLLLFPFLAVATSPTDSSAQSSSLTIGNYVKLSEKRISRTVYEFTYRADLTNAGPALKNVAATVTSSSPYTTVVANSLNFGDVPAGATVTSSNTFIIRQDRLYPFSWSGLTWNFQSSRSVGPDGGTLQFANGVVLAVPPLAVKEQTSITLKDLPLDQVNAILLDPRRSSTHKKRFIGGFSADPDGLVFDQPVVATIPVSPLNPLEIPAQIEIFLNERSYRYVTSEFEYLGDQKMAKVNINHFSKKGVVALTPKELSQLNTECTACKTYLLNSDCKLFDPVQQPCCLLSPIGVRPACPSASGCDCCREKKIKVVSSDTELTAGGCQIVGTDLVITFPECPGSLTEKDSDSDTIPVSTDPSKADFCKDIAVTMQIEPTTVKLGVGATWKFTAKATGSKNGVVLFQDVYVDPIWTSTAPDVAGFVDQKGTIKGYRSSYPGYITVEARLGGSSATASAQVMVLSPDVSGVKCFTQVETTPGAYATAGLDTRIEARAYCVGCSCSSAAGGKITQLSFMILDKEFNAPSTILAPPPMVVDYKISLRAISFTGIAHADINIGDCNSEVRYAQLEGGVNGPVSSIIPAGLIKFTPSDWDFTVSTAASVLVNDNGSCSAEAQIDVDLFVYIDPSYPYKDDLQVVPVNNPFQ